MYKRSMSRRCDAAVEGKGCSCAIDGICAMLHSGGAKRLGVMIIVAVIKDMCPQEEKMRGDGFYGS